MVLFGAAGILAVSACKIETGDGVGGSGGDGGDGGSTANVGGSGGTGGTGGAGGAGGAEACQSCGVAITPPDGDPNKLCTGNSTELYDKIVACVCETACKAECADTVCANPPKDASPDCVTCYDNSKTGACNMQFSDCANDI